jgi:Domain of unknown function (DUF4340)
MSFRNTLALAVLFLALAGYLYFFEVPRHQNATAAKKLVQFKPDDVTAVTLTYPDKEIALKKTAGSWRIEKPMDVDADQMAVSNLIRAVADAEVKRTLEGEAKTPDVYGLDKPEVVVKLTLADGKTLPAIRVGKAAPVGFSAYAALEGSSEVKLVPSVFQTGMKREVKDLRQKTVIDFQDADVQSIDVTTPETAIALVRDGDGWKIDKPRALKADPTEVNSFLSSLRGVRAEDFVDRPAALADYGLDNPREKISVVVGKDKTRKELWLGSEKAKDSKNVLYVKRPDADTVYAVGTWTWTSLNKNVASFRDKTVLAFDRSNVAAIEVTRREGEGYRLVREKSATAVAPTPPATPAAVSWAVDGAKRSKSSEIDALVGDLHGLKGYEIAAENPGDLSPYGLAEPMLTFSLIDADGKPIGRVLASQVGSGSNANAYAMAEGGDVVYRIRSYLYSHLDKKKEDVVEATPTAVPAPSATAKP